MRNCNILCTLTWIYKNFEYRKYISLCKELTFSTFLKLYINNRYLFCRK